VQLVVRDEEAVGLSLEQAQPNHSTARQTDMRKVRAAIAASVIAAAAVTGCAGHTSAAHGTVTGIFLMVGGPASITHPNGVRLPLPGRVIATSTTGERFTVSTGKSGRFTMLLPPGTYHLTGYSPRVRINGQEMRCGASHPVHVRAGKPVRGIEVFCSVP
jgi:hypothetical protein